MKRTKYSVVLTLLLTLVACKGDPAKQEIDVFKFRLNPAYALASIKISASAGEPEVYTYEHKDSGKLVFSLYRASGIGCGLASVIEEVRQENFKALILDSSFLISSCAKARVKYSSEDKVHEELFFCYEDKKLRVAVLEGKHVPAADIMKEIYLSMSVPVGRTR